MRQNDKNAPKITKTNCAKITLFFLVHFRIYSRKIFEGGGLGAWPPIAPLTTPLCRSHAVLIFDPSQFFTAQCTLVQSAVLRSHYVVRLSVTLVDRDHICWKSGKLIAQTISPTTSPFVAKRRSTIVSHGNMEKFWGN